MRRAVVAAVLGIAAAAAQAVPAQVIRVSDGDTVWVREAGRRPFRLRLDGLDAPERCQPGGETARAALAARVLHRQVELTTRARDMHGRAIGRLHAEGRDVGAWLVERGLAWDHRYRGRPGPYAVQERAARAAGRGVFADPRPEPPRDFRRRHGPCPAP